MKEPERFSVWTSELSNFVDARSTETISLLVPGERGFGGALRVVALIHKTSCECAQMIVTTGRWTVLFRDGF